jgi:hypothetical protein
LEISRGRIKMTDVKNEKRRTKKEVARGEIAKLERILKEKAASQPCGFRY